MNSGLIKTKILFVIPEYSQGGVPKSLENLVALMDKEKYDISIYCLYEDGGQYYKEVFKPYVLRKSNLYFFVHDNWFTRKFYGLWRKINKSADFEWLYKREAIWLQNKHHFDVVIAYQEGTSTEFVSYFHNVKKLAWIHCDYTISIGPERYKKDLKIFQSIDKIVTVSKTMEEKMKIFHPNFANKISFVYNSLDVQKILQKSELKMSLFENNVFTILSVGRFVRDKQFEKIPKIAYNIQQLTRRAFKWFIIASGDVCKEETISEINKYGVEDTVVLLGQKNNPYPYFKQADLYVCTSCSESFSYTIFESKILHTPVVSNNFPVAYEVLEDDNGWICGIDEMPKLLAEILDDKNGIYSKAKKQVSRYKYSNENILFKIDDLIMN